MKYTIKDTDGELEGTIISSSGEGDHTLNIGGKERQLRILAVRPGMIEFILDNKYHSVKYIAAGTARIEMVLDGSPIIIGMNAHLDDIVYKNAGGARGTESDAGLKSQIPGKVVSLAVKEGDNIEEGDPVAVLESMKMQITIKSHRAGQIKSLKVKEGGSVAKGDVIAEIG